MGSTFVCSRYVRQVTDDDLIQEVVERMGRWIDFRRDYKTMYPWFMESVWFIFKQLYEKGFVYRGFKVMEFGQTKMTEEERRSS